MVGAGLTSVLSSHGFGAGLPTRGSGQGAGYVATTFVPTDVTGLSGWYDFSDASTLFQASNGTTAVAADADPIGYAGDKTANAFHLIQATAGLRFAYKTNIQNGRAIGRGTTAGTSQLANSGKNYGSQPITIFAVLKFGNTDGTAQFDGGSVGHRAHMFHGIVTPGAQEINAGTTLGFAHTAGVFHVYELTFSGVNSEIIVDGTSLGTGDANTNALDDGFRLNGNLTPGAWSDLDVGELLIYAASPSSGNRSSIRAFLKARWGTP